MAGHRRRSGHPGRFHLSGPCGPAGASRPGPAAERAQIPPGPSAGPRRPAGLLPDLAAPNGRAGLLLPDLAFRLTAVRFAIPPLRQRREDIAPLAQALLDRICTRYQQRPVLIGPGTLARLLQHSWPGNVRELASVLETALLEAVNGIIRPDDLALPSGLEAAPDLRPATHTDSLNLDAVIQHHVQYVLDLNRGNKLRAARQLGISRSTLYRILGNETILAH